MLNGEGYAQSNICLILKNYIFLFCDMELLSVLRQYGNMVMLSVCVYLYAYICMRISVCVHYFSIPDACCKTSGMNTRSSIKLLRF